ncbi:plasmid mobilization protein [Burkholderia sp. K24]|jgi:hypothetical protein|nr:plasmid mobilization protein [Burkholderia sp. K24]
MSSYHHRIKSGGKGTAAGHAAYITRQGRHSSLEDLIFTEHGNMPEWAKDNPMLFWKTGDRNERANGAVYREHEIALPNELTPEQQIELAGNIKTTIVGENKPYQLVIHAPTSSLEGVPNTHLHLMLSDRIQDGIERSPEQTFSRHNAQNPERGGCKKDSGGMNRLELRDEVIETRRKCAEQQNKALAKYGHTARVDHRTLKDQGVDRKPERHLGQARIRRMSAEDKVQYVNNRQSQL